MKILFQVFKTNPEIKKRKNHRKLNKLLNEFSNSSDLNDAVSSNKIFRTKTFWENTEKIIPDMFDQWLKNKGYKSNLVGDNYEVLENNFKWEMKTYKYEGHDDYYVAYLFKMNPVNDPKPNKSVLHQLVVEIKNGYPECILNFSYSYKNNQYYLSGKYEKYEILKNFEEEAIHKYFKSNLEVKESVKKTLATVGFGMEQYNDILVIIRETAEEDFRRIAENYLKEMAINGIPTEGVPFQKKLDEHAKHLSTNTLDDYDLHQWDTNRFQLEKAIRLAKNKIITKYLNT